ncbi:sensor histidine kinase [Meridianimarinicoccus roseus]|uniref:C4-dicarboxylate transport sensor protein DctB n=1 Tax=Meridianimarinicoccus roseus TaxID=2072018 RepID=A0A2V2L9V1_9RHOB|nr:ATP-binding protein [Meridianimarinicoccus roseus]PWR02238.1 sensor histidine kinase [Meridianimarinicoccus roseus]
MTTALRRSFLLRSETARVAAAVLCAIALGAAALPWMDRHFQIRAGLQGIDTLNLSVAGLRGALDRFEPLPPLIAERPVLAELLSDPTNPALLARVNAELKQTAESLRASDVYLMDADGLTLAASSYLKELSFVGQNFTYRPYFTDALRGVPARYFALGTTSGERGYFFAAPVWDGAQVIGVLALKFTVDAFEDAWRAGPSELIVTDANGVVFMSSRTDWHFRTLGPLSPAALDEIRATRQYPPARLHPLDVTLTPITDRLDRVTIDGGSGGGTEAFVSASTILPDVGWRVRILSPAGPVRAQALGVLLFLGMIALLVGLAAALVLSRRARILDRLEAQRATQDLLEQRVRERTADLNVANASLRTEVEERRSAEHRLRQTQKELVQAGKLAALGQMSAAISHEINQPLAAVKSYADNAAMLLDRDRQSEARENMTRISDMADRIATISGHLRNFARRPQEGIAPVDMVAVVDDALDLMRARLASGGVRVGFDRPSKPVMAMGGQLRLQQVVVNLLSNALDATEHLAAPRIRVVLSPPEDGEVRLAVQDSGPGLSEAALAQVFDPFFTTKSPGKGLGLGLSISFNIVEDFGGHLRARNIDAGGAEFSVELPAAPPPQAVAAQ